MNECLPREASSMLVNCYQWGSWLPCETLTKKSKKLAMIQWLAIFTTEGLTGKSNSGHMNTLSRDGIFM